MKINDMVPSVRGEVKKETGVFMLPKEIGIEFGPFGHWCADVFLARCGRTVKCIGRDNPTCAMAERDGRTSSVHPLHADRCGAEGIYSAEGANPDILLSKASKSSSGMELSQEGYELIVSEDGIRIAATSEQGVVWALTTLALAMDEEGNDRISCGRICDAPRYVHRGLSLDCARHFFPAEEVKKIIEEISLAKMNVLHWHLTDDQGWRIESRRFPKLCEGYSRPQEGRSARQSEEVLFKEAVVNRPAGVGRQQEAFAYMASINSGMSEEEKEQTVERTAPNEEFGRAFMTKFFQPEDLPILMGSVGKE